MYEVRQDFNVNSISIELEFEYNTTAEKLWYVLTQRMGEWWSKPYSYCANRENFVLELKAGGRLLETGDQGAEHIWGIVTSFHKAKTLELSGPIGLDSLVQGWVRFALEEIGIKTVLKLSHKIMGDVDPQMGSNYTGGWKDMFGNRVQPLLKD